MGRRFKSQPSAAAEPLSLEQQAQRHLNDAYAHARSARCALNAYFEAKRRTSIQEIENLIDQILDEAARNRAAKEKAHG